MRRREFIAVVGAAAAWPQAARAQQPAMPVVGILHILSPDASYTGVDAIRKGLSESGYAEGTNVAFEYRWAENRLDRLPAMADDLVRRRVAVIVALGGTRRRWPQRRRPPPFRLCSPPPQTRSKLA